MDSIRVERALRKTTSARFSEIGEVTRSVIQNPQNTTARKFEGASGPFRFLSLDKRGRFGRGFLLPAGCLVPKTARN
jgi:hypothetical protein